jgi:hypothetical protein
MDDFSTTHVIDAVREYADPRKCGECDFFKLRSHDYTHSRLAGVVEQMSVVGLISCIDAAAANTNPDANYELMKALTAVPVSASREWKQKHERVWSAFMVHVASRLKTRAPVCPSTHKN